jgi:dTDP-4-dehydrorhamnose reductase
VVVETFGDEGSVGPDAVEIKGFCVKLLVTGASGLLGTRLCGLAVQRGYDVCSAYSQHAPVHGKAVRLDVTNGVSVEQVFGKVMPEVVVHAASLTDVDRCEREMGLAWRVNAVGTGNVAESCRKHGSFLVYVSTDYVFDGERGMYGEEDVAAPINYYGYTKLKGEQVVSAVLDRFCVARTSVIFGSNPASGKANFVLWLVDRLRKNERVEIVCDRWNSPTLNTSLAEMILEVVERELTGTFHLSGRTRVDRFSFSRMVARVFGLDAGLLTATMSDRVSWVARRPRDSSLDTKKAKRVLVCRPLEVEEALLRMKDEMG